MDFYSKSLLSLDPNGNMLQLLKRLQYYRSHFDCNDSNIPKILNRIGKSLEDSHIPEFPQLSVYFYLEQLRIEEFYFGGLHPVLADTLISIGEVFAANGQICEASEYFSKALFILNKLNEKGKTLALVLYNISLIQHHQLLFTDARHTFNLAIKEQQDASGEFHFDVAEMHLNIGKLQMEYGQIDDAMNNFLEALMIKRMVAGNNCYKVSEILYHIGFNHEMKGENSQALNAYHQSLNIVDESYQDDSHKIMILHKISLMYQCMGDIGNTIDALQLALYTIVNKLGENHIYTAVVLGILRNLYAEQGMIELSKAADKSITDICCNISESSVSSNNGEFAQITFKLFGNVVEDRSILAAAAA